MVLEKVSHPLVLRDVPIPEPRPNEVQIKVNTCGVCRTDLHIVDGDLDMPPQLPLIPGHQIVGIVSKVGEKVNHFKVGERIGAPWMGGSCHLCEFCLSGRENLCDLGIYNGYSRNGGFAEYATVREEFALPLPTNYNNLQAAPLLCAGIIGFRAYRMLGTGKTIGFYGFGSSAHLLIQILVALKHQIYVFTRKGDTEGQQFALSLGATWVGGSDQLPPIPLDNALIFAPVGSLYPQALRSIKKGGKVISLGIHMSDIPAFPYALLWGERSISSVTNLTRQDGKDYMELVKRIPIKVRVTSFALEEANAALLAIRNGTLEGSAVLSISK